MDRLMETGFIFGMMESFLNHSADVIKVFDLNGILLYVNPSFERVFGWKKDEVIGKRMVTIPYHLLDEFQMQLQQVYEGKLISGEESVRIKKDGTSFEVNVSISSIRDETGKVVAFSSIIRDISEHKKIEDLLRKTEKLMVLTEVFAGVAHEIRNPLTSLRGFLQILKKELDNSKYPYLDLMLSEIDRISLMVKELMELGKPPSEQLQPCDLKEMIHQVVTLLQAQAHLHQIQIHWESGSNIPKIQCKENRLKQALINLIKNSIESMQNGGEIIIELTSQINSVSICIVDQGCGIPEEQLCQIGQLFFSTKENGTGLGFMISQKIIKDHGGTMTISSETNRGTKIQIHLPIDPERHYGYH